MLIQARRAFRRQVASIPIIYLPLRKLTKREGLLTRSTDLLIDGYPRSGNSFAEAAFRICQNPTIELSHHSHAAAYVIQAVRWGIPTIVLIRQPVDAARSLVMHHPDLFGAGSALQEYIDYYKPLIPLKENFVLAQFETVISDFGSVIDEVNKKFDKKFALFEHSDENVKRAFALVDELGEKRSTNVGGRESYSPLASNAEKNEREKTKKSALALFEDSQIRRELRESEIIYEKMIDGAVR